MKASAKCKAFIRAKEKLELRAYRDGGGVLTIGWGHTGPDVHEGDVIDMAQAVALFDADVAEAEAEVERAITAPLSQGMYDALVSLEFNAGAMRLHGDQLSTLARLVNASEPFKAAREFLAWIHDGGKPVRGLLIRRLEEALMFAGERFPA
jgi:lysozyme